MSAKKWLCMATFFIVLGLIIFAGAMTACGWDFMKLSTVEYVENVHEITDDFRNVMINTDTADVFILPSEDGACRVECIEDEKMRHRVEVEDGTLIIDVESQREWHDFIGVNFGSTKIVVYIPYGECENIGVDISTGDVFVENMTAGDVDISLSTGDVRFEGVKCVSFVSEGSTGDVVLKNVVAEDGISIERSTGDVEFDGCDAGEIFVNTSTGDVTGSLLSGKVFSAETSTGDVNVPEDGNGGMCGINTSTGNIDLWIK